MATTRRGRLRRIQRARPDDELTLVEHLDELRQRIIIVLTVLVLGIALCFWQNGRIYEILTGPIHHRQLVTFSPMEAFLNSISISVYGGLLLALPVITYQLYAFVIPAFEERHHRGLRPLLLMIPGLFIIGVVFGWYIVTPAALQFLTAYNSDVTTYIPRARDYIQFVMLTLISMGLVFELPVVMMVLGRVGIVRSSWMKRNWRIAVVALAFVAALLPGADPITMIAEFIPLLVLYGFSYFLVRAAERRREASMADDEDIWPEEA
jgi:sec-independent protein translocase protein TatC